MIEPHTLVAETADARVKTRARRRLVVHGIVQGVGFRPHVWRLARDHHLTGFVRNTSGGVVVEVEGPPRELEAFSLAVSRQAPSLARIDEVQIAEVAVQRDSEFRIEPSRAVPGEHQPISPDAATCDQCLTEMRDPSDRRHRHPFINCTNCGPRFTIIEDIPYDRPLTTMRHFPMCERCQAEYQNPADRRFHAQPIACPDCGPTLQLTDAQGAVRAGDPITLAATALKAGLTVAVKGLGGFQLACDAADEDAVTRLRNRKVRPSKPFAVMVTDLAAARALCHVSDQAAVALTSPARPIVLLQRRNPAGHEIAGAVAPNLAELGVMLPYTPVHHLLLDCFQGPLVMTSGNLSEEPIAKDNGEAASRLGGLADAFLLHNRDIYARYDDSVVRIVDGDAQMLRRARGYCPLAIPVGGETSVLAFGAHLKNTFCIVTGGQAFVGPHIGDLDHPLSIGHQREALDTYLRLFRAAPGVVACDLHPDYASTRLADGWAVGDTAPVRVQHHHAHIASVMAEHGLRGPLLGVAFDGTGYGLDGTVWGGEFLICDQRSFSRAGHLVPVRQPGGDLCAREGWRMAASYLAAAGIASDGPTGRLGDPPVVDERMWRLVGRLSGSELAPLSSSAGRLFDAVASLLGIAHTSSFEAEAAMRMQALADSVQGCSALPVEIIEAETLRVNTPGLVRDLVIQRDAGRPTAELAAVFHESLAQVIADVCRRLAASSSLDRVALSGGVFQNQRLLERTVGLLEAQGLDVYTNRLVPANDGGVSLGQALVAISQVSGAAGAVAA